MCIRAVCAALCTVGMSLSRPKGLIYIYRLCGQPRLPTLVQCEWLPGICNTEQDAPNDVQGLARACLPRWATRARVLGWGGNSKAEPSPSLPRCGQSSSAWVPPSRLCSVRLGWADTQGGSVGLCVHWSQYDFQDAKLLMVLKVSVEPWKCDPTKPGFDSCFGLAEALNGSQQGCCGVPLPREISKLQSLRCSWTTVCVFIPRGSSPGPCHRCRAASQATATVC